MLVAIHRATVGFEPASNGTDVSKYDFFQNEDRLSFVLDNSWVPSATPHSYPRLMPPGAQPAAMIYKLLIVLGK
jgi:hypothetical protein